jgi:hypothetical protein
MQKVSFVEENESTITGYARGDAAPKDVNPEVLVVNDIRPKGESG